MFLWNFCFSMKSFHEKFPWKVFIRSFHEKFPWKVSTKSFYESIHGKLYEKWKVPIHNFLKKASTSQFSSIEIMQPNTLRVQYKFKGLNRATLLRLQRPDVKRSHQRSSEEVEWKERAYCRVASTEIFPASPPFNITSFSRLSASFCF